jgi:hypothetical protein
LTTATRPRLTLDDPLSGSQPDEHSSRQQSPLPPAQPSPEPPPAATPDIPTAEADTGDQLPNDVPANDVPTDDEWRQWGGQNRVASFRLPDELLDELGERTARLGLPIGQTVIAALTSLLDHDDSTLIERAERAGQAIARGKRRTRQYRAAARAQRR